MFTFPTMSRSTNTKTAKQGDGTELGICVTIVVQSSISVLQPCDLLYWKHWVQEDHES